MRRLKITALSLIVLSNSAFAEEAFPPLGNIVYLKNLGLVSGANVSYEVAVKNGTALNAAFNLATPACLDGESLTYRVVGTNWAKINLCLLNTTLIQAAIPIDTSLYIKSPATNPPPLLNAATDQIMDYPVDPALKAPAYTYAQYSAVKKFIELRTILVQSTVNIKLKAYLKNVKVTKGLYYEMGDRSEAAGIFIGNADFVRLDLVTVTGKGQGSAIVISNSSDVQLTNIKISKIHFKPYVGDRPFVEQDMREVYSWNNFPVYIFNQVLRKFVAARIQESVGGINIGNSHNVLLDNVAINGVGAIFNDGHFIPFQGDGITANGTNITIQDSTIFNTWEGIDLTGAGGVKNFTLSNLTIKNSFNYGIKICHESESGIVQNVSISNSGMSGIIVAAPAKNVRIIGAAINETGVVYNNLMYNKYWFRTDGSPLAGMAPLRIMQDDAASGNFVRVVNSAFNNIQFPGLMETALSNDIPSQHMLEGNNQISGMSVSRSRNFSAGGYSYAQVAEEYARINGCQGQPWKMISFWDYSVTPPAGQAPWTLERLRADLEDLKVRGITYCIQ